MSGRQDSNLRPPVPKTGALTGLRHAPNKNLQDSEVVIIENGGDGGIRTLGTPFRVRRFSKPVVSATHPRHQFLTLSLKAIAKVVNRNLFSKKLNT